MKIALIGDIALNGVITSQPEMNKRRFMDIAGVLRKYDFVFANLETPIKAKQSNTEDKIILWTNKNIMQDVLGMLNISCVSLANNHIYDWNIEGVKNTINALDKANILHTGAGWLTHHIEPVIIEKNKYKIAFLAYVDKSTNPKTEKSDDLYINYIDEEKIINNIRVVKSGVDKVILSLHWGDDYSYYPNDYQIKLARNFVEAGADIIMGHHPHVIQAYEKYQSAYILYSLGGLVFGDDYYNGKIRALRIKTKKGLVALYKPYTNKMNFQITKEFKGNHIKWDYLDYSKWSNKIWKQIKLAKRYSIVRFYINIKESVLDRLFDVLFGYYRNPLDLVKNINKINFLIRDFRNAKRK